MRKAIFAGSFNPFTIGHADIVERGLHLFDEIVIAIGRNPQKKDTDIETRKSAIEAIYRDETRVSVVIYDTLTVDLARSLGATALLRGIRDTQDLEYERRIAEANQSLAGIETVLLFTRPDLSFISSSFVRELQSYGKDVSAFVKQAVLALLLILPIFALAAPQKTTRIDKNLTIYNDVLRQLDINYVDTLNYEDLTETAINQMLRRIDPYTIYYPEQKDEELKMMTTGKYGGIGAVIQLRNDDENLDEDDKKNYVIIANPYEGKPAQRHDVLAGDRILSVDGWNAKGHSVKEVSDHLRGIPGSTIQLRLQREGEIKPIMREFTREEIHMEPVSYYCMLNDSVAYIDFAEFTEGSAQALTRALYELTEKQHARRLILDLRGNGGGIVDEAIQIVSLFVDKGTEVVSTKGKVQAACREYKTTAYPYYRDLPLTILVDKHSASASEIVSGSLQDLGRATLIGERTFGKGLVQNLRPIAHGGHLKVTTSKYYLPSGRCIQAIDYAERQKGNALKRDTAGGILPDIVLTDSQKVDICYTLYTKHHFFDYSVRYHRQHATIASPETFSLTDEDIEDFCRYLEEKNFKYETETSKYFADMIKMAENEDLDSATIAALRDIEPRLKPSFREAIRRNRKEVEEFLGAEIVERYYFQKGRMAYMLRTDKVLHRALEEQNTH